MTTTNLDSPYQAAINVSSSGDNAVVPFAGPAGSSIAVLRYTFKVAGAVTTKWKSSGGTVLSGPMPFANAGDGISEPETEREYFKCLPGESLVLNLSGAVAVGGHLMYWYE